MYATRKIDTDRMPYLRRNERQACRPATYLQNVKSRDDHIGNPTSTPRLCQIRDAIRLSATILGLGSALSFTVVLIIPKSQRPKELVPAVTKDLARSLNGRFAGLQLRIARPTYAQSGSCAFPLWHWIFSAGEARIDPLD